MRAFVATWVDEDAPPGRRLNQLIAAVFGRDKLNFTYDNRTTRTGAEAFARGRGNCVSFSLMFVALARHAGLQAYCQEVNDPPAGPARRWLKAVERHMNVRVRVNNWEHEVDFEPYAERGYDQRVPIDDRRALAHFHNNRAAELLAGQYFQAALAQAQRALDLYPDFGRAWSNLGVCYRELGRWEEAEEALLQALCDEVSHGTAAANLAALHFQRGDPVRAAEIYRAVTPHAGRNPYLQFNRARAALDQGNRLRARKLLQRALRLTPRYGPLGRAIARLAPRLG
jgi:tetratricopeptide (TPR) repeat protein